MANRHTKRQRRINLYRQVDDLPQPRSLRDQVLYRDKSKCRYCEEPADTVDHVVPQSQGGESSLENLVACCRSCNNLKGEMSLAEFLVVKQIRRGP